MNKYSSKESKSKHVLKVIGIVAVIIVVFLLSWRHLISAFLGGLLANIFFWGALFLLILPVVIIAEYIVPKMLDSRQEGLRPKPKEWVKTILLSIPLSLIGGLILLKIATSLDFSNNGFPLVESLFNSDIDNAVSGFIVVLSMLAYSWLITLCISIITQLLELRFNLSKVYLSIAVGFLFIALPTVVSYLSILFFPILIGSPILAFIFGYSIAKDLSFFNNKHFLGFLAGVAGGVITAALTTGFFYSIFYYNEISTIVLFIAGPIISAVITLFRIIKS